MPFRVTIQSRPATDHPTGSHPPSGPLPRLSPLIDPRLGDAEDDIASNRSRSLLAIGGRLLAEISLRQLVVAWSCSSDFPP